MSISHSLRQLATHTAGLPNDPRATPGGRLTGPLRPFSREEVLTTLRSVEFVAEPGTAWSYSSLGYALLGIVVADCQGASFEQALEELVLRPVGMESSGAGPFGDLGIARSLGYSVVVGRRFEVPPYEIGEAGGFGGVWSTAGDLAKFGSAHIGAASGPWSAATRADLHEPRLPIPETPGRRMATGFVIEENPRLGIVVGQNGEIDGYSACLAMVPATRTALAVLANTSNVAELITRALLKHVLGGPGG
jgi:CubicO group peptidase (beta-lactamase class C family)